MYLKQIIIKGFKSFADKTVIDLNKNITGIVGPNGSGKSNVVDAVKWVLGEQSIKSLRGEGCMSDVIFCGSKSRELSNYASVSLIFDNIDKTIKSEYDEIEIKRTVYKNNENEYYINKQRCRLKDINELLIDSGVQSFNIISQGDIANILSSKPEDRRIIIESAAKVLKYKKRKIESLKKLDKTKDNIDRINDITNELEQQLDPLCKQKEKAEIYLKNKLELENIEIALITRDIENLNEKTKTVNVEINKLKQDLLNIETSSNIDDSEIELKKQKLMNMNVEINELKEKLLQQTTLVEKINSEKNILIERKKLEIDDIKTKNNVIELKEQQENYKNKIETTYSEIKNTKDNIKDLNEKYNDILEKLEELTIKYQQNISNLNNLKNENINLEYKIQSMEKNIEQNDSLPYAVKSILNSKTLKGIETTIGKTIEVEDKYLLAINTALGYSTNFIICQNEENAKNAIEYLRNNNVGKATFFPLNIIKEKYVDKETLNTLKDEEIYIASDIVEFDKKYENIIKNQLGNIIITKELKIANRIAKLINYKYKIVTLEGDLIHVGGSMTGGTNKKTDVFSEKQELENLKIKKNNNETSIEDLKSKTTTKEIEELEKIKKELLNKLTTYEQKILIKDDILKEYSLKLENIENNLKLNTTKDSIDKLEEEIIEKYYQELEMKNNIIKKIDELTIKESELRDNIENMSHNLKTYNTKYNNMQKELKEYELDFAKYEFKLESLLQFLNEEYNITFEKAKTEYILTEAESSSRKKVNELKRIIKELGEVNTSSIEEFDRINTRYEFLNNQKDDLFKAKEILLSIIEEMDKIMKTKFITVFKEVQVEFQKTFKELFKGGTAELKLTDPENILETGIDIIALPPGKKLQHLSLLSGGEKSLTAIALLFSVLKIRPVPFCLLDEVEAALDESNVDIFGEFIKTFKNIQFIVITHKKRTMEHVDNLYGITMQESGVSKLVSVKLV